MNVESYSIVYNGLNDKPMFAAATNESRSVWAVASGDKAGGAQTLIRGLEEIDQMNEFLTGANLETIFSELHPSMQRLGMSVSVAGMYSDGKNIQLFNTGNARVFMFSGGYITMHTEDQTEAYEAYLALDVKSPGAFDEIRFRKDRLKLKKALGIGEDAKLCYYPPESIKKDDAFLICTDNFWRYLSVIEMELDFRKSAGPEEWLKVMARRVLMKAGRDLDEENFAAITAMIE